MEKKASTDNKSEEKWTEQFRDLKWKNIYTNRLSATKETKLQNFQYKFLMLIISTNKFLLKCNIAMSALCDFCTMEIETINHLFWEYLYVQQFWTELSNLLKDCNIGITFSLRTITFGITQRINNPNIQVKNFIILLAKYFIFKSKCKKLPLSFIHFKSYLKQRLKVEKQIHLMKDKLTQFGRKWSNFSTLIDWWNYLLHWRQQKISFSPFLSLSVSLPLYWYRTLCFVLLLLFFSSFFSFFLSLFCFVFLFFFILILILLILHKISHFLSLLTIYFILFFSVCCFFLWNFFEISLFKHICFQF